MRILLKSKVNSPIDKVNDHFDEGLFKYLLPPGAELIHYGGSSKGDIVHLKLPVVGTWKSEITDHGRNNGSIYFVDEGIKLPFPLTRWKHKHILHQIDNQAIIEDNIEFSTGLVLSDALVYPFLYLAFAPRIKQYKKYFAKLQ